MPGLLHEKARIWYAPCARICVRWRGCRSTRPGKASLPPPPAWQRLNESVQKLSLHTHSAAGTGYIPQEIWALCHCSRGRWPCSCAVARSPARELRWIAARATCAGGPTCPWSRAPRRPARRACEAEQVRLWWHLFESGKDSFRLSTLATAARLRAPFRVERGFSTHNDF